jgi:hypothetical protein
MDTDTFRPKMGFMCWRSGIKKRLDIDPGEINLLTGNDAASSDGRMPIFCGQETNN